MVDRYKRLFDESALDTEFPSNMDPHTVAALVKEYILDLPEPLIHEPVQRALLQISQIEDELQRIRRLKQSLQQLYDVNHRVLRLIIQYLAKLCMYGRRNFITPINMSIVWGPILLPVAMGGRNKLSVAVGSASPRQRVNVTTKLKPEQKQRFVNVIATMIDCFGDVFSHNEAATKLTVTTPRSTRTTALTPADTADSMHETRRAEKLGKLALVTSKHERNDLSSSHESKRSNGEDDYEDDYDEDDDEEDAYVEDDISQTSSSNARSATSLSQRKTSLRSFVNSMRPATPQRSELSLDLSSVKTRSTSVTVGKTDSPIGTLVTERSKPPTVKGISSGFLTSRAPSSVGNDSTVTRGRGTSDHNHPPASDDQRLWMQFVDQWKSKYHMEVDARKLDQEDFTKSERLWSQKQAAFQRQIDELQSDLEHARLAIQSKEQEFALVKEKMQLQYDDLKRESEEKSASYEKELKELKRQHLLALKHYGIEDASTMVDPSQRKLSPHFFRNLHEMRQKVHHAPSSPLPSEDDVTRPTENTFASVSPTPAATEAVISSVVTSAQTPEAEQIFNPETMCFTCRKPIETEWMEAEEKRFHYECFRCAICDKAITGPFKDNKDGSFTCKSCLQPAGTVKIKATSGSRSAKTPSTCAACDDSIRPGDRVRAMGKAYHRDCFRCMSCGSEFENMKFYALNENPVCADCKRGAM